MDSTSNSYSFSFPFSSSILIKSGIVYTVMKTETPIFKQQAKHFVKGGIIGHLAFIGFNERLCLSLNRWYNVL